RLAASGDAEHRHEAVAFQAADQLGDLLIASKKEMRFFRLEGAQTGIGIFELLQALYDRREAHGGVPVRRSSGVKNSCRRGGLHFPYCPPTYSSRKAPLMVLTAAVFGSGGSNRHIPFPAASRDACTISANSREHHSSPAAPQIRRTPSELERRSVC